MPVIKVRENESFDVALRRFKRSCEKAGILAEVPASTASPEPQKSFTILLMKNYSKKR